MNSLVFSFVVASVVAILCVLFKGKENRENSTQHGIKVFAVTAVVVFVVYTYMIGGDASCPEIETGEPPF